MPMDQLKWRWRLLRQKLSGQIPEIRWGVLAKTCLPYSCNLNAFLRGRTGSADGEDTVIEVPRATIDGIVEQLCLVNRSGRVRGR